MPPSATDTIVAIATPAGQGGVGVVRLSGPQAPAIAREVAGPLPPPRTVRYARFLDADGSILDDGLLLCFAAPASFTGEDVVELQAHGSPVALQQLVARCIGLGARAAGPGEFSERAFLNGKLDLAQTEAVADLIAASSVAAARAARRSLDGAFSTRAHALAESLTALRVWVEAAIDFPEEEIDFLADAALHARTDALQADVAALIADAERGRRLVDGLHVVIAGAPNAGKSSLLNALAGEERAIVTDIAGTTRDLVRENLRLAGTALTLVDTAGLRDTADAIEAEGVRRARAELERADLVLAVLDAEETAAGVLLREALRDVPRVLWLHNKIDLSGRAAGAEARSDGLHIWMSARTGAGLEHLIAEVQRITGLGDAADGAFSARARHVEALRRADAHVASAASHLRCGDGELAAEELRLAHDALGELTGRVSSDALLGRVFASFCIGK
ncbi:tRNA uridine-5-carboxymethylaminomethyl(34) synthesis GTPase MnmE [Coralloluteibacterium stylophorae]|uniref:tRNA modification GTPase MnmE n=1 Tax=Coralloluteibacterium stylophorae TaxID=1776034 RepID=A0AAP2CF35_9GAMM|nr:tRNA uridine-5-carboxymethylaminomethyl(34) synthesis GTPase MnmE [Coralloluteibacterium stylophorae]MBS7458964.1 tRNA uridine-5-carboxymethylaminomethyl(34) synthesis GTPase MnmE [Coralloluteibacterium stylophorae]